MKTAISIPDAVYDEVERRARELGMNRSEFYATAATRYLAELQQTDLTARMNAAIAAVGEDAAREQRAWAAAAAAQLGPDEGW